MTQSQLDADLAFLVQFQNEIEAEEASRWLRAAGFPQYAQMYEDGEFPIDISSVEKDHDFLDKDQIQSIFRRLNTLNKCAIMKIEAPSRKLRHEESDDEDQCALSDKWKYQRTSRRWSRKDLDLSNLDSKHVYKLKSTTSQDSLLQDQDNSSPSGGSPVFDSRVPHTGNHVDGNVLSLKNSGTSAFSPKLRRAASERIKSAKNLLRKVESFKTKRPRTTRKHPKTALDISGPVINDSEDMQAKIQHLNCVDISPTGEQPPFVNNSADQSALLLSNDNSRLLPEGDISQTSDNTFSLSTSHSMPFSSSSSYSDNPTHTSFGAIHETPRSVRRNQSENDLQEVFILPIDHKPGSFPKVLSNGYIETPSGQGINYRTGSFNLGKDSDNYRNNVRLRPPTCRRGSNDSLDSNRVSVYDNVHEEDLEAAHRELDIILHELFQNINGLNKALNCESDTDIAVDTSIQEDKNKKEETLESSFILDSPESIIKDEQSIDTDDHDNVSGSATSNDSSDHDLPHEELLHDENMDSVWRERRDSGVGSSLTRPCDRKRIRWHSFQKSHRPSLNSRSLQLCSLSVGQYMVFRKVALLKLTSLLEKYSPTNRTGWNWSVPRFMKRHKSPEYSDKSLFAVPLLLTLQRTGQPLPQCILFAMRYLRQTCNDAVGIFRKSGVRSRIQKLREDLESNPDVVSFEDLQAYDVADLLKQFFRDLPDCLLTSKLSETFISIFTHVPPDLRFEAMQAAIILMPDENREVLQCLLLFLSDISQCSDEHQMTASNLAVCFAPSLFNVCNMKGSLSASPKRNRKNHGTPDVKEIMEQKAAHDCLTSMIHECKKLFTIPVSWLSQCRFSYMEQSDTITMEQLNKDSYDGEQGYKYLTEQWIQGILKESHDKFKGWVHLSTQKGVDVSFKKVGDGHPLRLWKATIDVEAPPIEVLNRLLTERHLWDEDLLKWRVVEKLDKDTDVFQFVRNAMAPHPTRDYCVLRAWKSNLPRGTCVFVSSSIEHPQADLIGGIRAVELASRYLIEPCGAGKSRVTHISRIDTKGMSSDWYNKSYGHICRLYMMKIRDSFKQKASGPETKV